MTEEAKDLELEAKGVKAKVVMHTTAATELLNKRMPPRVRPVGDHEDARLCQGAWGAGGPAKAHSPQSASRNSGNPSAAEPSGLEQRLAAQASSHHHRAARASRHWKPRITSVLISKQRQL